MVHCVFLWNRYCIWTEMTIMEEPRLLLTLCRLFLICIYILHLHFSFREILLSSSHLIYLFFILCCFSVFLVKTLFFCFKLWKRFKGNDQPKEQLGSSREYNVDMIPKVFRVLCNILLSVRYSDALMLSNYTFHPMFLKHR